MVTATEQTNSALDGLSQTDYHHLSSFRREAQKVGSRASRCQAKIDLFRFPSGQNYEHLPELSTRGLIQELGSFRPTSETTPVLLIVEDIDLELIQELSSVLIGHTNESFSRFFDDFLNDMPSYEFEENIAHHLPPLQSTRKGYSHLKFQYYRFQQFERNLEVSFDDVQIAAAEQYWRRRASYGVMHPRQRLDYDGVETKFPPLFVQHYRCAVWFDTEADGQWKTGVILVEPTMLNPKNPTIPLSLPLYPYLLDRNIIPDFAKCQSSYRTTLSALISHILKRHRDGTGSPIPTPPPQLTFLEGIHRIVVAEWMVVHIYCLRDINTIEWRLQGGSGNSFKSTKEFEDVLSALFGMRRRLNRYCDIVEDQRTICAARGSTLSTPWMPAVGDPSHTGVDDAVWTDLVADYDDILRLLQQDFDRLQRDISYIASLLAIQQASLGTRQGRLVLVLTVLATFLLPIGTMATVLSMEGDWAPSGGKFTLFWAISVPISVVLMGCTLAFMYWGGGGGGKSSAGDREVRSEISSSGDGCLGSQIQGGVETGSKKYYPDYKWATMLKRRPVILEGELSGQEV
ncbi:hypothetical protein B0T16DRAFT_200543 [Cercophora newfieldiana]|uniref:Uncharacterized protein n=1 Tax=Cercophora newfieldiana TaxID=92897 RepID=A0AA40CKQ0_9PEZI|nr:hypothetical protein B0T16DRAFT_200543 [Cercophora newfieldiana]